VYSERGESECRYWHSCVTIAKRQKTSGSTYKTANGKKQKVDSSKKAAENRQQTADGKQFTVQHHELLFQ
jgi:hypothetical protein